MPTPLNEEIAGNESWVVVIPAALLTAILGGAVLSQPDSGPQPPCGSETIPPYPDLDKPPTTEFWDRSELGRKWTPPACTGWTTGGFAT